MTENERVVVEYPVEAIVRPRGNGLMRGLITGAVLVVITAAISGFLGAWYERSHAVTGASHDVSRWPTISGVTPIRYPTQTSTAMPQAAMKSGTPTRVPIRCQSVRRGGGAWNHPGPSGAT